jgi:hypothetical protein
MFYPGSGSDHLLSPDPDPNIFSSPNIFLASYAFKSKFLVLVIVKKIRDPEKIHPGSRIQGLKAPDPQHWFGASVLQSMSRYYSTWNYNKVKYRYRISLFITVGTLLEQLKKFADNSFCVKIRK